MTQSGGDSVQVTVNGEPVVLTGGVAGSWRVDQILAQSHEQITGSGNPAGAQDHCPGAGCPTVEHEMTVPLTGGEQLTMRPKRAADGG
ncbi:hypothetical protein [Kitasatospora azatica]|uniref:hypothetical protein n=1 Tax=Kitasatospora azatica TaxID=58347 RepID=UPI00055CD1BB|nr:hypothetical protein [Kitasatospora azatica]